MDKKVLKKFQSYPKDMRQKLMRLRQLILDVASKTVEIGDLEETLKWGEPSYLTNGGSTVRIDWKESNPEKYTIYFNCNTKLVDTFKKIYSDKFNFEGNRAIVFHRKDKVPTKELKHCIELSLLYHNIKHLPMLGV
jgi:hypothetical protein